ncbi:MAG: NAD(P)H-hydrate dehydratase [Bacteroidales bacterium]
MKIPSIRQIKEADEYTIKHEPVSSADLMERAAGKMADRIAENYRKEIVIKIFSGPGNNGGDGLALGRLLTEKGFRPEIFLMASKTGYSSDTSDNLERLRAINISPLIIASAEDFPPVAPPDIIVDALFGTGLSRPVTGLPAQLIDHLNDSGAEIISVDIPSGLFGDDNRNNSGSSIIKAKTTLSFQFPKMAFMFTENEQYTGNWEVLDIGLHREFINRLNTRFHYLDAGLVKPMLKIRNKFAHKGIAGHCLLISGSYGRMGAAVLAATSCLRSGAGLVTVHVPVRGCDIVQNCIPEAMVSVDKSETCFSALPPLNRYDAVAAGPATGTHPSSRKALQHLLKSVKVPLVLDADALNIISMKKEWPGLIPENSIITPHPGEFDRLAGNHKNSHDRLVSQIAMAKKYKIIIVLKGAFTSVVTPEELCFFNSTGNPGMATAGSGDVLTGILLSLLGQGYDPVSAALTGVYLHGMAGDIAASEFSPEALIAGDISLNLGKAYESLKK